MLVNLESIFSAMFTLSENLSSVTLIQHDEKLPSFTLPFLFKRSVFAYLEHDTPQFLTSI